MNEINVKNMSVSETRKMQKKMLEILLYYKDFCDQHDLMFYLCGGCCIGAIRHNGFIPWDDDVDCFMPRKDYEKFKILWDKFGNKEKYTYCRTNSDEMYHHAATSLRDNNTTFINKHSADEDICHGIALEFAPIDGCPKAFHSRVWQLFNAFLFALFNTQRLPDNKGGFFRGLAAVCYKLIPGKKIRTKIWQYAERQMSKYSWDECDDVTELIGSVKGMLLRHPKERFASVVYKRFEGYDMPVMVGYDEYLRLIFGNYMNLPPEEKRVAKHNTVYIDIDNSYKNYKGLYYCTNKKKEAAL